MMETFRFRIHPVVFCGPGSAGQIAALAGDLGFTRTLLVADPGLLSTGHIHRVERLLRDAGFQVFSFHDFSENPDSLMVEKGRLYAAASRVDSLAAVGGGSSLDCAKAVNFVLTNGGRIQDYWGYGKASKPMLPMIGVPTTTGTGSEAQSYALISDAETHRKMACGDPKAAFRAAILDPELAVTQPARVRAVTGYDAISHAVESLVTTERSPMSAAFSREAWRLLDAHYERALARADDMKAIAAMQLGAFQAGVAVENSMLGAAHACANPLTQLYGTAHGIAIAQMLPHVVRWNQEANPEPYRELHRDMPARLRELSAVGELPSSLRATGVPGDDLPELAERAAVQWTGRFNPRSFDRAAALELYERAW